MTDSFDDRPTIGVSLRVNGRDVALDIEPRETIAFVLRERMGLTGAKVSCDAQVCGACTVLVDGRSVSGCTYLAVDAHGANVETVEGLATNGVLTPVQQAFIDCGAFQCGYCTPGMIMAATELLRDNPRPSRTDVIGHLEGNICRCTGYEPIVSAVLHASAQMEGEER
jgi:aerobic-type carbon monoxide dehydrogenase small subunit (CoxS/CutS family)